MTTSKDGDPITRVEHTLGSPPVPASDPTKGSGNRRALKSFGTVGYAIDLMNVVNEKPAWKLNDSAAAQYVSEGRRGTEDTTGTRDGTQVPTDQPIEEPRELGFLNNQRCGEIRQLSGGGVVFQIGHYTLTVDAAWRITGPGGVLLSRSGQQHLFSAGAPVSAVELVRALIGQSQVIAAVADPRLGDLAIAFSGGLCLEVWNDASGADAWSLQGGTDDVWRGTPRGVVQGAEPETPDETTESELKP